MDNVRGWKVIEVECGRFTEEEVGGLNEDEKAFLESLKRERAEYKARTGKDIIFEIPDDYDD